VIAAAVKRFPELAQFNVEINTGDGWRAPLDGDRQVTELMLAHRDGVCLMLAGGAHQEVHGNTRYSMRFTPKSWAANNNEKQGSI
jgi:hypothetical protein